MLFHQQITNRLATYELY